MKFNPDFRPDWVKKTWLFRTRYAQPVPLVNHSRNIPAIKTPLAGLYFASMSQVYPWDRGTNFAVEIGRRAARMMIGDSYIPSNLPEGFTPLYIGVREGLTQLKGRFVVGQPCELILIKRVIFFKKSPS